MLIIAERLNATRKAVRQALADRDADHLREEARRQSEAGADYLDLNTALSPEAESELMAWAVDVVREVTDTPLAIDSASPEAARVGLARLPKGTGLLNSISGESGRLGPMAELAAEFEARVIALAMDDAGMPESLEDRWRAAEAVFAALEKVGVGRGRVFVDPLVRPVSTNPEHVRQCLEMMASIRNTGGGAGTVVGLSNVSYGLPKRKHLNRTFLAMAMGAGLTAAILDPLDAELMATLRAGACLTGDDAFCMNYITAEREGKL